MALCILNIACPSVTPSRITPPAYLRHSFRIAPFGAAKLELLLLDSVTCQETGHWSMMFLFMVEISALFFSLSVFAAATGSCNGGINIWSEVNHNRKVPPSSSGCAFHGVRIDASNVFIKETWHVALRRQKFKRIFLSFVFDEEEQHECQVLSWAFSRKAPSKSGRQSTRYTFLYAAM